MLDLPAQGSQVHVDFGDCVRAGTLSCIGESSIWGVLCEVKLESGARVLVQPDRIQRIQARDGTPERYYHVDEGDWNVY